jgi:hypothetical protein
VTSIKAKAVRLSVATSTAFLPFFLSLSPPKRPRFSKIGCTAAFQSGIFTGSNRKRASIRVRMKERKAGRYDANEENDECKRKRYEGTAKGGD